jgi:phage terminase small subunit
VRPLSDKQKRFVQEYLIDQNATQAYKRAGYKVKNDHVAQTSAHNLLLNSVISEAIKDGMADLAKVTRITAEYVLTRLRENVERAMQIEPVLGKDGIETGEFRYDGAVANKGLELLGKHLGIFDKVPPLQILPGSSPENPLHVSTIHDVSPGAIRSFISDLRRAGIGGASVAGISPDSLAERVDSKDPVAKTN